MEKAQLDNLLAELYEIDPSLKQYGDSLRPLVLEMINSKPDTKFDGEFASRLKKELMDKIPADNYQKTFTIATLKNKKWYFAAAGLAICGFAVLSFLIIPRQENSLNPVYNLVGTISPLKKNAFGSLSTMDNAVRNFGFGAGNNAVNAVATRESTNIAPAKMALDEVNQKIAAPSFEAQYSYVGDKFDLNAASGLVYRRVKGQGELAKSLMKAIQKGNFAMMDLNSFQNLKLTNLSFLEDRDSGLMINFDFVNDNFYFSENSERWEPANSGAYSSDRTGVSDTWLIEKSNDFFQSHKINLKNYGAPVVINQDYPSVVYPLLIGESREEVYDQSGTNIGLRVVFDLSRKEISSVDGLALYQYQSSEYELVTNQEAIIKVAEKGGWNQINFAGTEAKKVSLGTPKKALVQLSRFSNNQAEELLVPALIFPSTDGQTFYGRTSVVVPLVKEIFEELE
ncbi:MAG: hypothetical protein PHR57_03245 [Patescibacteria group bacterium]|nr:hypothetical protein [Patescibacteria group bacterium]